MGQVVHDANVRFDGDHGWTEQDKEIISLGSDALQEVRKELFEGHDVLWLSLLQGELSWAIAACYCSDPQDQREAEQVIEYIARQMAEGLSEWLNSLPRDEQGKAIVRSIK